MDPEAQQKSGKRMTVADMLDHLPVGRFHAFHLLRMILAWAIFSTAQESTPYMFPGLRKSFQADEDSIATFAASFPLGCAGGAILAARLLDRWGRRGTLIAVLPVASILSILTAASPNVQVLTALRTVQAFAFSVAITGMSAWYIEFLPTSTRGMLMAAYSIGWPIGRGLVILLASLVKDRWTDFLRASTLGLALLFSALLLADESPRYLAARGRTQETSQVLARIYASNLQARAHVALPADQPPVAEPQTGLLWKHRSLLAFAALLFIMLSSTTVLLDTWGPHLYHQIFAPESSELPHGMLMLFNVGDLAGILCSIALIDRIGRFGSFVIGFLLQGCLLVGLSLFASAAAPHYFLAVACGTLSSACRCFAWESAQMWTLEVFPTPIRATAFSVCMAIMRLMSIVSLKLSAHYVGALRPTTALQGLALLLCLSGLFSTLCLPKETAKMAMSELPSEQKSF